MAEPTTREHPIRGALLRRHFSDDDGAADIPAPRRRARRGAHTPPPAPTQAPVAPDVPTVGGPPPLTLGGLLTAGVELMDEGGHDPSAAIMGITTSGAPVHLGAIAVLPVTE